MTESIWLILSLVTTIVGDYFVLTTLVGGFSSPPIKPAVGATAVRAITIAAFYGAYFLYGQMGDMSYEVHRYLSNPIIFLMGLVLIIIGDLVAYYKVILKLKGAQLKRAVVGSSLVTLAWVIVWLVVMATVMSHP